TRLNTPAARTLLSRVTTRSITSAILLLACFGLCPNAPAQELQSPPVARLMSEPVTTTAKPVARILPALDDANAVERRAFEQTNMARAENGLPPLAWDPKLCRMARAHSERMALRGFFSHETPEGLHLKERAHESGILHFKVIGENIAYNKSYDDPGGFAVERWLTSSGHRANILYVGFQASAIGSYVAADGSTYLTQVFIAR
ncbi:MAG: CAP domain-containing protein, partial [Pyrinomonadaceae bacterium]